MYQQAIVQGLLESTPDGVAIFDNSHRIIFVNRQYSEMWGETVEQLLTMSRQELYNLKLSRLQNPEMDAHLLHIMEAASTSIDRVQLKLKNSRWYERLAFEHLLNGVSSGYVVQWRDVTSGRIDLSSAHHERDMIYSMMDNVRDAMFFKDKDSRYIRVNASMAKRLGLSDSAQAVGLSDADFYASAHAQVTRREELQIMDTRIPLLNQVHQETWADGSETWSVSMKMPLLDTKGLVIGTYGIAHDITEQKKIEANTWHQANFDPLTNLPNRRLLRDRWEQAVYSHRRSGNTLALMLLDLDHFKEVNDTLGHAVGDVLLVQASARIATCLRSTDTVARLGGDEFAIILTDVVDIETIGRIAQKIVDCLFKPFDLAGQQVSISGSVGISMCPHHGNNIDVLMKQADEAMYTVKAGGRNGYSCFNTELKSLENQGHLK
jgi:diguanylate cyclase (GGDEF)-like protein/PAS domain S-box-containing protein